MKRATRVQVTEQTGPASESAAAPARPLPVIRTALGGFLMGLANLVPGISGGTMIVVVGLYDEFVSSIADVTRLRFTKRGIIFLAVLCAAASAVFVSLAGAMSRSVTLHRSAMFSLFIGMTLGGVPVLLRMSSKPRATSLAATAAGLAIMLAVAAFDEPRPGSDAVKEAVAEGRFIIEPAFGTDLLAGLLGMSAMVLPGISGAYMLLVLGRYETLLAAVALAKDYALADGDAGDASVFLRVLVPAGLGALIGIVGLSNVLKFMLRRHRDATIGFLLGIVLGSVVGIWPFDKTAVMKDYLTGSLLAACGLATTILLSKIKA